MRRLLDGEASALERSLLEASTTELPGEGARARALSAALAAGTGTAVATGGTKLLSWSALKLLSVIALAAIVAAGLAVTLTRPRDEAPPERVAVARASVGLPAQLVTSHTTASAAPLSASAPPSVLPAPAATQSAAPSIAEELALLDRARYSLGHENAAGALRILDEHDRDFPNGAFALEARVLRVHALVRLGRRAEAEAAARPVLEQAPGSVYAKQVHDLLGS